MFGELGARGVRLECMGGARGARGRSARAYALGASGARRARERASGASACVRTGVWRAGVRAGRRLARGRARGCERGRAAGRAATGVLFTREHILHPESPKWPEMISKLLQTKNLSS
ncbi:hypothetical protein CRG98_014588 [Punica granatum]|uniref:Uncharacterized protein n=1 Tax=Punica granatum TaxID=22663 RepID=A0A2I0KA54_PUNGR|nr:hypothetical protein CRG98_014588 [Punica granatum]